MEMKLSAKDLSLTAATLELLREVEEGGKRVFEPETDAPESIARFQEQVKLLRALETRRLIAEIESLNMTRCAGKSVIDKVRLRGGLTEKGKAVLAHMDAGGSERVGFDCVTCGYDHLKR